MLEPIDLQKVVSKTTDTPEEAVVQMMMLRSLKQAHYSEEALGHFGLAAEYTILTLLHQLDVILT